jgi:hypothetical protein
MKKVISKLTASTAREMIEVLQTLCYANDHDTVYVTINSDAVRLSLVEETLSDGSLVYNIELSEVSK